MQPEISELFELVVAKLWFKRVPLGFSALCDIVIFNPKWTRIVQDLSKNLVLIQPPIIIFLLDDAFMNLFHNYSVIPSGHWILSIRSYRIF